MSESSVAPAPGHPYTPDAVVLYGTPLAPDGGKAKTRLDLDQDGTASVTLSVHVDGKARTIAVVVGYAFDGQCHRFERPRILAFNGDGEAASGCGFDDAGYQMWRVSRLAQIVEVDLQAGSLQDTLQDIHETDERGPGTYASKFQMMHRHKPER